MLEYKDKKDEPIFMNLGGRSFLALPIESGGSHDEHDETWVEVFLNKTIFGKEVYDYIERLIEMNNKRVELDDNIIKDLLPVFKNSRSETYKFYNFIVNENPKATTITRKVTCLVQQGIIDQENAKGTLHAILTKHGLYTKSLTNWNKQVVF